MFLLHASSFVRDGVPDGSKLARRRRREEGLTLVELLIALALLAFILLAIAPLFIASVKSNYSGNEYTSANMLARDRLEQLMNRPFLDPQLAPGAHTISDQPLTLPNPLNPTLLSTIRNPFKVTYTVEQFKIPPSTGVPAGSPFTPVLAATGDSYQYKRIDVTVDSSESAVVGTQSAFSLGFGSRLVRVSGCLANPAADANLAVAPCGPCP
ncbi:MAG TPA: prepilin-type N-terminal cleavage/methylation domain-containing protein [Thermoanaerobaculia bacterium]|nr:prepilin-type N-terminal cleavage/methylation domain-containing protein [Thermoanaerobaculia bacterium]